MSVSASRSRSVPDVERSASALVVRRNRDEVEDLLDIAGLEPSLEQSLVRAVSDETLRAGAGVDPVRLDADDPTRPALGRRSDAAEHHHLLGPERGHRRSPANRPLRPNPHLGAQSVLALDDPARDLLREHLDEQRLAVDEEVDRTLEELREARHVHALLVGGEVDRAVDRRRHHRLGVSAADPHRLLHSGDPRAREGEPDLGLGGLEVVVQLDGVAHRAI